MLPSTGSSPWLGHPPSSRTREPVLLARVSPARRDTPRAAHPVATTLQASAHPVGHLCSLSGSVCCGADRIPLPLQPVVQSDRITRWPELPLRMLCESYPSAP